jgi:hypothetical protein
VFRGDLEEPAPATRLERHARWIVEGRDGVEQACSPALRSQAEDVLERRDQPHSPDDLRPSDDRVDARAHVTLPELPELAL